MNNHSKSLNNDEDLLVRMSDFFGPKGGLSFAKGYEYRKEQQEMACLISSALESSEDLIVEAGTGVGKSLAYLAPAVTYAVENDRKAVISTKTINLQEQIIEKDLPLLQDLLEIGFSAVLLKGRANYLCPRRLKLALNNSNDLFDSEDFDQLEAIRDWAIDTVDGTLSDLDFDPASRVWSQVCSESRICTPRSCSKNGNCFYQKAREEAANADVIVVNHTLLFTLMESVEESMADFEGFIFDEDFLVIDEAHELEDIAANQLGIRVSQSSLIFDLNRLYDPKRKRGLLNTLRSGEVSNAVVLLHEKIIQFFEQLEGRCDFGQWGREFRVREPGILSTQILEDIIFLEDVVNPLLEEVTNKSIKRELLDLVNRITESRILVDSFLKQSLEGHVYWVEKTKGRYENLILRSAPVNVADQIRSRFFEVSNSCILTSATLSIGENKETLGYVKNRVGAELINTAKIGSPYDYQSQMKIFLARGISDPRSDKYEKDLAEWIMGFVKKSKGSAFVLFTSYKLMNSVFSSVSEELKSFGINSLIQGKNMPRNRLIKEFKEDSTSVLFGTDSFWAGVDVPGEALSNVIVTRIPFAVPNHPLIQSRLEQIENLGGNPFLEYSVPEAILKLRQGVGRLIRSASDKGFVVILDNRVLKMKYGKAFIRALPPAPVEIIDSSDISQLG